jgi:hypothetical protein
VGPRILNVRQKIVRFDEGLNNLIAPLTPGARPIYIAEKARPDNAVCNLSGRCAKTRVPKGKSGDIFKLGFDVPHKAPREIVGLEEEGKSSLISLACVRAIDQYLGSS